MNDLRLELERCLQGKVCLMGIGNEAMGDDGLGARLAQALGERLDPGATQPLGLPEKAPGRLEVIVAGVSPERWLGTIADGGVDQVLLVDAVEFGEVPGSVILLSAAEIKSRYPQISTHKISLGLLAEWLERATGAPVWLLGVQPASLEPGSALSPKVRLAVHILVEWMREFTGTTGSSADREEAHPRDPITHGSARKRVVRMVPMCLC
jgi:hydrogenase maturation protease